MKANHQERRADIGHTSLQNDKVDGEKFGGQGDDGYVTGTISIT